MGYQQVVWRLGVVCVYKRASNSHVSISLNSLHVAINYLFKISFHNCGSAIFNKKIQNKGILSHSICIKIYFELLWPISTSNRRNLQRNGNLLKSHQSSTSTDVDGLCKYFLQFDLIPVNGRAGLKLHDLIQSDPWLLPVWPDGGI